MQSLEKVPCLNVNNENFTEVWPLLVDKITSCSYLGIDFEFSGIGLKSDLKIKDLETRYEGLVDTIKQRTVLSIGLSIFEFKKEDENLKEQKYSKDLEEGEVESQVWNFHYRNFNILCECEGEYIKDEGAYTFLKKHDFNFEDHEKYSIKYKRGNDDLENTETITIRNLFNLIIKNKKPVVFHNGFIDLLYFYHHFYCELPKNLQTFISDLSEIFSGGIFDTKLICELYTDLKITFLEYIFYYLQRMNILKIVYNDNYFKLEENKTEIKISDKFLTLGNLKSQILKENNTKLESCKSYKNYGWCIDEENCPNSHNIDFILDSKFSNSKKEKNYVKDLIKMKKINETLITDEKEDKNIILFNEKEGVHAAGYDAFMTAFCFSYFLLEFYDTMPTEIEQSSLRENMKQIFNCLYLPYNMKRTLCIKKSHYSKVSEEHKDKIKKIKA